MDDDFLDVGYFRLAKTTSKLSDFHVKIGAVLARKKPISAVCNVSKTHPLCRDRFDRSTHAEIRAINICTAENITNTTMYVYREDAKGNPKPDTDLRDYENIPFLMEKEGKLKKQKIEEYFEREVKPHVPDAWIDESKTKTGYEINFTKYFYEFRPLRPLEEIRRDILALEKETDGMIREVVE